MMRNRIERNGFALEQIASDYDVGAFDCGDNDLNEYFHRDRILYRSELLTQTYRFYNLGDPVRPILALVDFCNDAQSRELMAKSAQRKIHHNKRGYKTYPAIKITRLGVDAPAQKCGIGSFLLNLIKEFFITDNRSGCRFITVDAYRAAVPFYERNGFVLATKDDQGATVPLFFDLKRFVVSE